MKTSIVSSFVVGVVLCVVVPCFGMGTLPPPEFKNELLAKSEIDECFNGIGQPYKAGSDCSAGEEPKANQAYLWGLSKAGDNLWIGTGANMICLMRAYGGYRSGEDHTPSHNSLWTCEYAQGQYVKTQMPAITVPDIFSDFRPPKIYTYNVNTGILTDRTSAITSPLGQLALQMTFGLRSSVAFQGMVILSGPMAMGAGINMFAFDAGTGAFLGAGNLPQYQNIRKWLIVDNVLYAAVADESGGGKVLRWTGTPAAPFTFAEVGVIDGSGAEIVAHNGRIFVGTWPDRSTQNYANAGIWMSPAVPPGGLTTTHANAWTKVWQTDDYEPDPLNASIYGVGAMASYGGYLYWGTMHVHGQAFSIFNQAYDFDLWEWPTGYLNSWRATAIFRARSFDTTPRTELLYGDSSLMVYVPYSFWGGYWTRRNNNMGGVSGKFGTSGFGNKYNMYTWTMAVYKDQLFAGTMDHSYLWLDWDNLFGDLGDLLTFDSPSIDDDEYGADLWRFPSADSAAVRVTRDGFGNYTNYGFRTVVVDDVTDSMYLGTANPCNIAQDVYGNPIGGWELIRVYKP